MLPPFPRLRPQGALRFHWGVDVPEGRSTRLGAVSDEGSQRPACNLVRWIVDQLPDEPVALAIATEPQRRVREVRRPALVTKTRTQLVRILARQYEQVVVHAAVCTIHTHSWSPRLDSRFNITSPCPDR